MRGAVRVRRGAGFDAESRGVQRGDERGDEEDEEIGRGGAPQALDHGAGDGGVVAGAREG